MNTVDSPIFVFIPIQFEQVSCQFEMSNYRPVSVLNTFSKFYKKVIKKQLVRFMEEHFSPSISAYRANYSSQYVIIRLLEERRKNLDDNVVVGPILTDLSKAFDCILYDLLIAKPAAYGLSEEALMYILSYLSNRKQCVLINDTYSEFENIITGVPQGSILGPFLFSLSINDLFFFILIASVHNFADDHTLSPFSENISKLINILQTESEVITDWLKKNQMIVNPDKSQEIIIDEKKGDYTKENVVINNNQIKTVPSVELLGSQLDDKLNFSRHISNICKSAANQLNDLIRILKFQRKENFNK